MPRWPHSAECRFVGSFDIADSCWVWTKSRDPKGYGKFFVDGRYEGAHRFSYEFLVGPIPPGLHLDHLCRNRACVNPAHLEPVTPAENVRRGAPAQKSHCVNGHVYDSANTYWRTTGQRDCRACGRDRVRRYKARSVAA